MKSIFILAGLLSVCGISQAQSTGGNNTFQDTTHRMGYHHHRPFNSGDSAHRKGDWANGQHWQGQGRGQDQAMNRHRGGHGDWNGQERGQGRGSYGFRRQGFGHHGDRGGMNREHWIRYSPEQRKQLQAINTEYRRKQQDLYKNDKMTLGDYKTQLLAMGKEKKVKMQALLTPEQKDRVARMKKMAAENAQVKAVANLERMKIRLNLSDEQAATLKSQQANLRSQFQSIRENDNLLPQQKMEQMKALAMKRQDALKSVLTPDQLSKFQAMHTRHWGGNGQGQEQPFSHQD